MRTYERNGVHVDQCADCRGIFLDRGELDRLIDAENAWHGDASVSRPSAPHRSEPERSHPDQSGHQQSGHQQSGTSSAGLGGLVGEVLRQVQGSSHTSHTSHSSHSSGGYKRKKKESFLGELFG